jgi:xylulokinase
VRRGLEVLAAEPDLAPGQPLGLVRLSGGGARHSLVPQLLADLLGVPVEVLPARSATALGAARLAAAGVGAPPPPVPLPEPAVLPSRVPELEEAYGRWLDRAPLATR